MTGIAACMASKRLPNQITGMQLNETISDLINSIPDSISTESSAISGETTQPLRIRLRDTEFGVEHVKTDVRACGLLADDPSAPGTFRFGHKSFMEYLVASAIAERIQNKKSEKAGAVLKATYLQIEDILALPVAIDFLSELLVGIRDDKESDDKTQEVSIAKRLFSTIIGEGSFRTFMLRPAFFGESLIHSLGRKMSVSRRALLRVAFNTFPLLVISMPLSYLMMSRLLYNDAHKIKDLIHELLLMFFMTTAMLFSSIMILPSVTVRRKLELWSDLCKRLGVKDKVLHEIVGTSIIPWVREQPFDYEFYRNRYVSVVEPESEVARAHKSE